MARKAAAKKEVLRVDIVTGFPALLKSPLNESIVKQAKKKKIISVKVHDLRAFTQDKHKTIDDAPYGGGAGMVLKPEPIFRAVEHLQEERQYDEVIYVTADGERFDQKIANQLSLKRNLLFLCGHYKGIDERVREKLVTREISIGDYVLTGGELAVLVIVDAVIRLIPGVLGDGESMLGDSFQDDLLDNPSYTRPSEFRSMRVPEVLLSGDHKAIAAWRRDQRLRKTSRRRKDLLS